MALLPAASGFAAHPLITEDTGTQGRGNAQLELTGEFVRSQAAGTEEHAADYAAVLTYGLRDNLDALLTLPYSRIETEAGGTSTTVQGLGDIGLDAKWRFFEQGPLSVATKAGLSLATGDDNEGLGAGKSNASIGLVASYQTERWACHLHLARTRNRNVHDERNVIHHASIALTAMVTERLELVADLGRFTTADRAYGESTRFLTLGAIYGVRDDFDLDFGLKRGLSEPEADTTVLLGVALRF